MSPWHVFTTFLKLGLTAFGGPIAHLAYFQRSLVQEKRWLNDADYAQLVALCQILPGPTSSQVGIALGLQQAGIRGALAAWLGFTLPSILLLVTIAYGLSYFQANLPNGLLQGLAIAAVAIVIQALWSMSKNLCPDWSRRLIAMGVALFALWLSSVVWQIALLALAGLFGLIWSSSTATSTTTKRWQVKLTHRQVLVSLGLLIGLLISLPLVAIWLENPILSMVDHLFRTGALVFGGGHVVLPLLYDGFHQLGVSDELFLAGYGITQAMPGPLLSFAAFLGAVLPQTTLPLWLMAAIASVAIFLPSLLFVIIALPYWQNLMQSDRWRQALWG
ncbi:MAG: chromate efflux transporter, partial [Gammaproteobacteria bacterium]|nr:chromate efflux transporter [Gammaproteobacteria bacterium]